MLDNSGQFPILGSEHISRCLSIQSSVISGPMRTYVNSCGRAEYISRCSIALSSLIINSVASPKGSGTIKTTREARALPVGLRISRRNRTSRSEHRFEIVPSLQFVLACADRSDSLFDFHSTRISGNVRTESTIVGSPLIS